jgi:desulfoferrodoxin-like iron-binding protein
MGLHKKGETWVCQVCGIEVEVTREGGSTLVCCGKLMSKKA